MKKKSISLNMPVVDLVNFTDDFKGLPSNEIWELEIDYPLEKAVSFQIKTGDGMGLPGLLREIGKAYKEIYANKNKYGVWGHGMRDLQLESIDLDFKKAKISLVIGS